MEFENELQIEIKRVQTSSEFSRQWASEKNRLEYFEFGVCDFNDFFLGGGERNSRSPLCQMGNPKPSNYLERNDHRANKWSCGQ